MSRIDFYKQPEKAKPDWHENHAKKAEEHQGTLSITPEKLAEIQADAQLVKTEIAETEQMRQSYLARVNRKNTNLDSVEARTRANAKLFKAVAGYTESIGIDLGIIGAEAGEPTSPEQMKPEVTITMMPGRVRHDWRKKHFDALVVRRKRGAETTWTKLDTDTKSPFDDEDPNLVAGVPEKRDYMYVYVLDGIEVGIPLELTVVVLQ